MALTRSSHPITRIFGAFFALIGLPLLVFLAWQKAPTFDPFTQSFFTRFYVEPTPGMPGEIRIGGWVFIAIGALLVIEPLVVALLGRMQWKHALLMVWLGALVAAFGSAFFVAADSAEFRIKEEWGNETRTP